MAQPDPVVDAARKLLVDLMSLLKEKCPGGNDQPVELPGPPEWIPELDMALGTRR